VSAYEAPFLALEVIEDRAEALLQFARKRGVWNGQWPVPVDEIAEIVLKLTIELGDLAKEFEHVAAAGEGELLGAFDRQERKIWIAERLDPVENPKLQSLFRFTLAHEIGHPILHSTLSGIELESIYCRGVGGEISPSSRRPRIEYQADAFAGFLTMPRALTIALCRQMNAVTDDPAVVARRLAGDSLMSQQAARIRVRQLGDAAGQPRKRQSSLFESSAA
jgi:Zn-dependent peptidase ImmA (M78 family)